MMHVQIDRGYNRTVFSIRILVVSKGDTGALGRRYLSMHVLFSAFPPHVSS